MIVFILESLARLLFSLQCLDYSDDEEEAKAKAAAKKKRQIDK